MATHCSIVAWELHRQESLAGYSPCDRKKLDVTEATECACMEYISFKV